ncbi:MAG TPA: hypothetical protein PKI11_04090 [Candidatus Hydrogenedentes bacterium]|nr:hypothetical protein [Candidatus Hydrogenedentota bacterium]HNT86681.1 hypothetical protein [Candidatus Hydrogenedentota bacterium]
MEGLPCLKGALHTHTTCSDGRLTPLEVLRAYRDLGYDFVALTDHDFLVKPDAYAALPDRFEDMLVFKGVEKTVFARGYVHVNVIPGREETLHVFNHPAEYGYSVAQLLERIALVQQNMPLHAIEVTAKGFYTPEYDIESLALPKVASDDSHTRDMCGRAWITAQAEREHDAVLRAIKAGQARVHYGAVARQRSWAHFGE